MEVKEFKPLIEEFIRSYLKECECVYPSDVADALGLEYDLVVRVFAVLEKEEKICKSCE